MKEYEKQKQKHENKEIEDGMADTRSKIAKFFSAEKSIVSKPINPFSQKTKSEATPGTNVSSEEQRSKLPSFWIPSLTPDSTPTEIKKPVSTLIQCTVLYMTLLVLCVSVCVRNAVFPLQDNKTYCPMSGAQLRVKDLISINFTPIADRDSKTSLIVKKVLSVFRCYPVCY